METKNRHPSFSSGGRSLREREKEREREGERERATGKESIPVSYDGKRKMTAAELLDPGSRAPEVCILRVSME